MLLKLGEWWMGTANKPYADETSRTAGSGAASLTAKETKTPDGVF